MILSLTTGIRTEEARALRWDHVDLDGELRPIITTGADAIDKIFISTTT